MPLIKVSSVSPFKIRRVNRNLEDAEELDSVTTSLDAESDKEDGRPFSIIKIDENAEFSGEAFFFAVNKIAGATRGLPDLLSAIDWLEGLDQFVFALMERGNLTQNIVYDLEFQGKRTPEIRKGVREFVKALKNSGGVYGHNEKAKLTLRVPQLGSSDAETAVRILLKQVQSGSGLAGLFYGDSDDLTRASASELTVPVAKMIQGRQNFVQIMLTEIFAYQIQAGVEAKVLPPDVDRGFEIQMPRVYLRDLTTVTTALTQLSQSLEQAVASQWITVEEAREIFRAALEQLGPLSEGAMLSEAGDDEPPVDPAVALAMERQGLVDGNGKGDSTAT